MHWKFLWCLAVLSLIVAGSAQDSTGDEKAFNELPCLSFGGMCVMSNDCPEGYLATVKGLCPVQQKSGVECCHSVPRSATRCREQGGDCVSRSFQCPENLTFKRATDCKSDEKCCIFV